VLVLFDIDLTLIDSSGAGVRSMVAAGQRLYGPDFSADGIPFGGQLDPLIVALMLQRVGVNPTDETVAAFRAAYHTELENAFRAPGLSRPLPGVPELLDALERHPTPPTLGLLTGNFEETGRLKLLAAGIDPDRFKVRVWGDDSPHHPPDREHLPLVGIERDRALRGRALSPDRVTLIGDTTHDVRAARVNGCRVLAVATGRVSATDLAAAGATRVVPDLSDTEDLAAWITTP